MSSASQERPFYQPRLDPERDLRRVGFSKNKRNLPLGPSVALLIIDMSPIFVEEMLYPNAEKGVGRACVNAISDLLDVVRPMSFPVIYTTGYRFGTESEHGAWMYRFGDEHRKNLAHFDRDELHEIDAGIAPQEGDVVLLKAKPSAFFGTQLTSILVHHGVDTLLLTGMSTAGCVRATAVDGFSLNYKVVVPQECVADSRRLSHEAALYDIDGFIGDVRPMSDIVADLRLLAR